MKVHAKSIDTLTGIIEEFITNNKNYVDPVRNAVSYLVDYKNVEWESPEKSGDSVVYRGIIRETSKKIEVTYTE